jgi:hypothetical protein
VFEAGHELENTLLGLRNRRVWRLVEETRYGDCNDPEGSGADGCPGNGWMVNY